MERIFIFIQHIVPQQLLSRATGWLAGLERPGWFKNGLIKSFVRYFDVDLGEAVESDPERYSSFNDFFSRPLVAGARPLAAADIICPADGAISQLGDIANGRLLQAKGRYFSATELLGGDAERAAVFDGGHFATVYLSPRDYHRVHMPLSGRLTATVYVPGRLFSVNGATAENVDRLFARNERLVCHFQTRIGPMVMVMVGAMIVAGIETVWAGQVAPPPKKRHVQDYANLPAAVELEAGDEMGRFMLGSTVILLFPRGAMAWAEHLSAGSVLRMGQEMGSFCSD